MRFVDALKWTLLHRGISLLSLLIGLALAGAGIVLGFGEVIGLLVENPTSPGDALQAGNPAVAIALVVLGTAVWLLGKSYALYLTMPRATGKAAVEEFDMKQVRSEVLDALDDRLSAIEDDLQATRRSVAELKRREHATSFDEDAFDASSAVGSPSSSSAREGPTSGSGTSSKEPPAASSTAQSPVTESPGDSSSTGWQFGDEGEAEEDGNEGTGGAEDGSDTASEKADDGPERDPLA